jgi:RNA polymerase sigma-70 factor, ECF subfamily
MADAQSRVAHLYKQYGPIVYRRCLRLLKNPEAARDATQDIFIKLLRDLQKLEGRATVLPWIHRVATNHCLNLRRDAHRRGEDQATCEFDIAPQGPTEYSSRALAQRVLARFDRNTQLMAVGVLVEGMGHQEMADLLGVSRRTVLRALNRFLAKARKYLTGPDS